MGCIWATLQAQPWLWWLMVFQFVGVVGLVAGLAGYVLGVDRWANRGQRR